MKAEAKEWLEGLLFWAMCLLAIIILIIAIIFLPVASALNRIKKTVAIIGLVSEQQELLKELNGCRESYLDKVCQGFSNDEDYSQAQMVSSFEGYAVLYFQEETRKLRKANIKNLIDACYKTGIAKWRVWLVKP